MRHRKLKGGDPTADLSRASADIKNYRETLNLRYQALRTNRNTFDEFDVTNVFMNLRRVVDEYNGCIQILLNNASIPTVIQRYNELYNETGIFLQFAYEYLEYMYTQVCLEGININIQLNKKLSDYLKSVIENSKTKIDEFTDGFINKYFQEFFVSLKSRITRMLKAVEDKERLIDFMQQGSSIVYYKNLFASFSDYINKENNEYLGITTKNEMNMIQNIIQQSTYSSKQRESSSSKEEELRKMSSKELKRLILQNQIMTDAELQTIVDKDDLVRILLQFYQPSNPREEYRTELNRLSTSELKQMIPNWQTLGMNDRQSFIDYLVDLRFRPAQSERKPSTPPKQRQASAKQRKESPKRTNTLARRRREEEQERKAEMERERLQRENNEKEAKRAREQVEYHPVVVAIRNNRDISTVVDILNKHIKDITGNTETIKKSDNVRKQLMFIKIRVHPDKCFSSGIYQYALCNEITSILEKNFGSA
jgi:hypothetical protein